MNLYDIKQLKFSYNGKPVIDIKALTIQPSAILGLAGPNGSGKSTLLKILALIERPNQGQILFKGIPIHSGLDKNRLKITLLPQEPYLLKRSVYQNVAYGLHVRHDSKHESARVKTAMNMVGLGFDDYARRQWFELSGGEAHRVALAARLILKPEVLLLDEPTANVDAASLELIKKASIKARDEWNTTLIIASHDWEWLYTVCDDVSHLIRGKIFGTGLGTMLFGPWQEDNALMIRSQVDDNQCIMVNQPEKRHDRLVGIIDPSRLTLYSNSSGIPKSNYYIKGTVVRLWLEKQKGSILAGVSVGHMIFAVRISSEQAAYFPPGTCAFIGYQPDCIYWLT